MCFAYFGTSCKISTNEILIYLLQNIQKLLVHGLSFNFCNLQGKGGSGLATIGCGGFAMASFSDFSSSLAVFLFSFHCRLFLIKGHLISLLVWNLLYSPITHCSALIGALGLDSVSLESTPVGHIFWMLASCPICHSGLRIVVA